MSLNDADPVKLFFGVLFSDESRRDEGFSLLEDWYGAIDFRSSLFPFDQTDYYVEEMGTPIHRMFIGFERLIAPGELPRIKIEAIDFESGLSLDGNRRVNLDPGYLDYDKVVLASTKYNGDKIYLDRGIWADLTLRYKRGVFEPYPWSFPDFKTGRYSQVFLELRRLYKEQRRYLQRGQSDLKTEDKASSEDTLFRIRFKPREKT